MIAPMSGMGIKSFIGYLSGVFMTTAAAAQDLPLPFPFAEPVYPFSDMDVGIVDLTLKDKPENFDPDIYHLAYRDCAPDNGPPLVMIYQWPEAHVKNYVAEEYIMYQRDIPGISQIIFGKDGELYDMADPKHYEAYMAGTLRSGLDQDSAPFARALHKVANGCLPKF